MMSAFAAASKGAAGSPLPGAGAKKAGTITARKGTCLWIWL